ncbi:MAG: glycine cleavage system protein GcvH [Acidobacteriota bacterium]|nr:glycine cleavage system protein GcvH [Acidobacteriota bacterium]MDQ7086764.1 glycine cleavage system protein GcvH [Acidobacteriota bacterium]
MPRPEDCLFTKDHEWLHVEGGKARLGITDFAQGELGDIVYVDLGEAGRSVARGEELGTIESVKAVAEVYAPVAGEVTALNDQLADAPEKVNEEPFGDGWLAVLEVADASELDGLMNFEAYQRFLEEEDH